MLNCTSPSPRHITATQGDLAPPAGTGVCCHEGRMLARCACSTGVMPSVTLQRLHAARAPSCDTPSYIRVLKLLVLALYVCRPAVRSTANAWAQVQAQHPQHTHTITRERDPCSSMVPREALDSVESESTFASAAKKHGTAAAVHLRNLRDDVVPSLSACVTCAAQPPRGPASAHVARGARGLAVDSGGAPPEHAARAVLDHDWPGDGPVRAWSSVHAENVPEGPPPLPTFASLPASLEEFWYARARRNLALRNEGMECGRAASPDTVSLMSVLAATVSM